MKMMKERLKGSSKAPGRKNKVFVSPGLGCRENPEPCALKNTEWSKASARTGQVFFGCLMFVDLVFKLIVENNLNNLDIYEGCKRTRSVNYKLIYHQRFFSIYSEFTNL